MAVLFINGPNLNMLGIREVEIYGCQTLEEIEDTIRNMALLSGVEVSFFQSNHEGQLIDRIQEAFAQEIKVIIINAGAFTHYSIALYDALLSVDIPVIEVHLTNIYKREDFRNRSLISPLAAGGIFGFGALSYQMAFLAALEIMKQPGGEAGEDYQ